VLHCLATRYPPAPAGANNATGNCAAVGVPEPFLAGLGVGLDPYSASAVGCAVTGATDKLTLTLGTVSTVTTSLAMLRVLAEADCHTLGRAKGIELRRKAQAA